MSPAAAKSQALLLAALLAAFHVAHVTGLRNVLAVTVTLLSLINLAAGRSWPPLAWPLLAWVGWGAASSLWSLDPEISMKSVLYDIVMPAGALYGAYLVSQDIAAFRVLVLGVAAGMGALALSVLIGILTGQAEFLLGHEPAGLLYLYPGPGAASTLAIFALPLAMLLRESEDRRDCRLALVLLACIVVIALGSQNRMVWPAAVITLAAFYLRQWPRLSPSQRRRLRFAAYAAVACAIGIVAILSEARTQGFEGRLQGWREWAMIALEKPWGFGLGKRVLGGVGVDELTPELQLAEPAFILHAHNLLLNTWLQAGALGLGLYCVLLCAVARYGLGGKCHALRESAALLALLVGMLAKNAPDDFMDHAVVVAFWAHAGILLGRRFSYRSGAEIDTSESHPR